MNLPTALSAMQDVLLPIFNGKRKSQTIADDMSLVTAEYADFVITIRIELPQLELPQR